MKLIPVGGLSLLLASAMTLSISAEDKPEAKAPAVKEVVLQDIKLNLPESWKSQKPENKLRLAQFDIPAVEGDEEGAALVVSAFNGGGGLKENMPRWIGEFRDSVKVVAKNGECAQGAYELAEVSGLYVGPSFRRRTTPLENGRAITIVLMPKDKPYYYLKLSGPAKTVDAAAKQLRTAMGADGAQEKVIQRDE